jgi:N-acetylglucosamine-6-phosphate deacetylase
LGQAVTAGAVGFTHLGNGCPRELGRHDNILWRVLETPGLIVGMIPDAMHVSPTLFRLLHRLLQPGRIYYTTDAMAAAASPPGTYRLGNLSLAVGEDAVVRLPGTPYFAGSALRPFQSVERANQMLDCRWTEAWQCCSITPARFAGLPCGLAVGLPANFCLLRETATGGFQIQGTV